ncbi:LOW QUALITY PROTEIN: FYN-binding protein 1-like [Thalassophryne amazonica]|uniref:LOW QUALITY PROTEIN: FYN-binding protein 1-like n=1 Tax=Thalassophryne amazonica TaxID=390379 RepID=UPI00147102A5|nr:LOW QUALITY PROTEIN: FYN-binding protein 1-like [Thalassophryne amazonica]
MDNKADVKAIMARFQGGGTNSEDVPSMPAGHTKQPLHATLSSGPTLQTKKPISGSNTSSAMPIPQKPTYMKNTILTKSDTDISESHTAKSLAARFANKDDASTHNKPLLINKQPLHPPQAPESQSSQQKPTVHKPPVGYNPGLSKPSPAFGSKPSWVKDDNGSVPSITNTTPPKVPPLQHKPSSSIQKLRQQTEEITKTNTDIANKPFPPPNSALKPLSNYKSAQNVFIKEQSKSEHSNTDVTEDGANKPSLSAANTTPPPKPPTSKKPSIKKPVKPPSQTSGVNGETTSEPKRNPLLNSLALGTAPVKPNRPLNVNLERFRNGQEAADDGPGTLKKPFLPPPPTSHPSNTSNQVIPTQPNQPTQAPSLPPRHPGAIIQPDPDENYDDVGLISSPAPPPLPPTAAHPSQRLKSEDNSDGEMYEDLDERWEMELKEQEKKREKEEKEEKRIEAEKKEQKEREKKEQDARKKFKLVGPLEAIHKGTARVDCRGGKAELSLKQGECVDIIRVQGNPEGKWLGQTQDGSIGYVKITSVEIDFNTLKSHGRQQAYEPDVYDDIDVAPDNSSGIKGPGVVLPLPPDEEGEIYDDVIDQNLEVRIPPPPSQFTTDRSSVTTVQPGAAIDEEIYDDVDSQNLPPLPPISSIPMLKGKNKNEETDPKKQKKFEKEEKEFRKKFKYDGPIQVLDQVTILPTLTIKKWSGKDLPVKPGEKLDVIVNAVENKLICRNDEGKFGYVLTSHIVAVDAEIYDDIGNDCIYDND